MTNEVGVVRIDPKLSRKVKEIILQDDNKIYCSSLATFVNVAVREQLDKIENDGNKIRWKFK